MGNFTIGLSFTKSYKTCRTFENEPPRMWARAIYCLVINYQGKQRKIYVIRLQYQHLSRIMQAKHALDINLKIHPITSATHQK